MYLVSLSPPTVQIVAGQISKGYQLVAKRGTSVKIRLADDDHLLIPVLSIQKGLLSAVAPFAATPRVQVGTWTLHRTFEPAPLVGSDANGEDHRSIIPAGQPAQIHVSVKTLR
jgi:hypothetical protein